MRVFVILKVMTASKQLFLKTIKYQYIYLLHCNTSSFKEQLAEMMPLFHFHTSPNKSSTVAARYINPPIANFLA